MEAVKLDKMFRKDSAARKVAERLLTGKPMTRNQLVDGLGISVTTVNRVVADLEEAGCVFSREVVEREAQFRLLEVGEPKVRLQMPALAQSAQIVRTEVMGDAVLVDFIAENARYRGVLHKLGSIPPVGKDVEVTAVALSDDRTGIVSVQLDKGRKLTLDSVRNVTPDD